MYLWLSLISIQHGFKWSRTGTLSGNKKCPDSQEILIPSNPCLLLAGELRFLFRVKECG
jgi:hypothetical protein